MNETKDHVFQRLGLLVPIFSRRSSPFAGNDKALTVDVGDGTVIKAFRINPENPQLAGLMMTNEIACLKILGGEVGNYRAPELVEDPVLFRPEERGGTEFFGYVRMTKLDGRPADWRALVQNGTQHEMERHGVQVGSLIATLHQIGNEHIKDIPPSITSYGTGIYALGMTDPELQMMVGRCHDWYRRRFRYGFAHVDLADRNMMVDDRGNVTGVLDFAISGTHLNPLFDFHALPEPILDTAFHAFRQVSGRQVDPSMVTMTRISFYAEKLSQIWLDPAAVAHRDDLFRLFVQSIRDIYPAIRMN